MVIGSLAVALFEYLGHLALPLPEGISQDNKEVFLEWTKDIPLKYGLSVIFAHLMGPFFAGIFVTKLDRMGGKAMALIVGLIFTVVGVSNWLMIPSPTWFIIADTLVYVPFALLGWRIAK